MNRIFKRGLICLLTIALLVTSSGITAFAIDSNTDLGNGFTPGNLPPSPPAGAPPGYVDAYNDAKSNMVQQSANKKASNSGTTAPPAGWGGITTGVDGTGGNTTTGGYQSSKGGGTWSNQEHTVYIYKTKQSNWTSHVPQNSWNPTGFDGTRVNVGSYLQVDLEGAAEKAAELRADAQTMVMAPPANIADIEALPAECFQTVFAQKVGIPADTIKNYIKQDPDNVIIAYIVWKTSGSPGWGSGNALANANSILGNQFSDGTPIHKQGKSSTAAQFATHGNIFSVAFGAGQKMGPGPLKFWALGPMGMRTETVGLEGTFACVIGAYPGVKPPDTPTPPNTPPPPPPFSHTLEWRSIPQAFGEIKNVSYSPGRLSEAWEVTTGVPHDESLYYDGGASDWSGHVVVRQPGQQGPESRQGNAEATGHVNCGAGSCAIAGCRHSGGHYYCPGHPCDHGTDSDCDGNDGPCPGGYECSVSTGCEDNHGSMDPHNTDSVVLNLPSIAWHELQGAQFLNPSVMYQEFEYLVTESLNLPRDVRGTAVYTPGSYTVHVTDYNGSHDHKQAGCNEYRDQANIHFDQWAGQKIATFYPPKLTVTIPGEKTYELFLDDPIEFWSSGSTRITTCGGTYTYTGIVAKQSGGSDISLGSNVSTSDIMALCDKVSSKRWNAPAIPNIAPNKCHWLLYGEFWKGENFFDSGTENIEVHGYNGDYSSAERRDRNTPLNPYNRTGLMMKTITNGWYGPGGGYTRYIDFGSGATLGSGGKAFRSVSQGYDSSGTPVYTNNGSGGSTVNNVLVHSPVAIDSFGIGRDYTPADQRVCSHAGGHPHGLTCPDLVDAFDHITYDSVYLTPSMDFSVYDTINWEPNTSPNSSRLPFVGYPDSSDERKGREYEQGMDTSRWIAAKYYRFPFEVIHMATTGLGGGLRRYAANTWIKVPVLSSETRFVLPSSEVEMETVRYDALVIAKNSPHIGNPDAAWNEANGLTSSPLTAPHTPPTPGNAYMQNFVRNGGTDAVHAAFNFNQISIVGRIGNFAVEYTSDPNWSGYFTNDANPLPSKYKWYLGPNYDLFDYKAWEYVSGTAKNGPVKAKYTTGLSFFSAVPATDNDKSIIPSLRGDFFKGTLPAGPGKNLDGGASLLQNEAIKMGYPVWWSIQTLGNYGQVNEKLNVYPKVELINKYSPISRVGAQEVDIWVKQGDKYIKYYDYDDPNYTPGNAYDAALRTKLTHDERRIAVGNATLPQEKYLTNLVTKWNPAVYGGVSWDTAKNISIGTLNKMELRPTLRTFIGGRFAADFDQYGSGGTPHSTVEDHAKQTQRWHGTLFIPSSARFTAQGSTDAPKESDFLPVGDKLVLISLDFETDGPINPDNADPKVHPWNITTGDKLVVGSNYERWRPWYKTPPEDGGGIPTRPNPDPPEYIEIIPQPEPTPDTPNPVIILDPSKPATKDVLIHGTH